MEGEEDEAVAAAAEKVVVGLGRHGRHCEKCEGPTCKRFERSSLWLYKYRERERR